jgi:Tfp pilus assembly pilus retraction ATPase PilT
MSLMPSLCAALERAGGERLVMRAGERPHVLAGARRHDVASAILSVNAVEALSEQILSNGAREELSANGAASETVQSPSFPHPLTARAARVGDDFCIELIVTVAVPPMQSTAQEAAESDAPREESSVDDATIAPSEAVPTQLTEPMAPVEIAVESGTREWHQSGESTEVIVVSQAPEPVRQLREVTNTSQDFFGWVSCAADLGASTLYMRAGSQAAARIDERIQSVGAELVDASVIEEAVRGFTDADGSWQKGPDGEWVREDDELGEISCRVFIDVQGTGLIVRLRPQTSLRLLYKHIPRQVRTACEGNGLIVVAASSETDVECLAAAVADWSGRDRGGYLISLQRRNGSREEISGAFVSQRTVAGSERDPASAIRLATQERPDILLVTGLQTEQALHAAVLAAAGGGLVIVGVVASTTVEALRMLAGSDSHVRRTMATSFRAAIGYRSLRRIGGGRVLVQDIVLATPALCALLEAGDFDGVARTQRAGAPGMRSVDESLARAVRRQQVSLREAAGQAIDRSHLVGIIRAQARTSSGMTRRAHAASASIGFEGDSYRDGISAAATMIGGRFSRS